MLFRCSSLFLLIATVAFGQAFTPRRPFIPAVASGGGPQTPTNQVDYPYAYYIVGTNTYATNAGNATLTDQWINHLDLTNSFAGANPVLNPTNLNGLATLSFPSSGRQLAAANYVPNYAGIHEVIMVAMVTNQVGAIFGSQTVSGSQWQDFYQDSVNLRVASVSSVVVGPRLPVRWLVIDVGFNGGKTFVITNNITMATNLSSGSAGENGLTLCGSADLGNHAAMEFATWISFTNSIQPTSRSNIFWFFTNKYNIAP